MLEIILGCFISNIILIAIFIGIGYYIYNKNKDKIVSIKSDIENIISDAKSWNR